MAKRERDPEQVRREIEALELYPAKRATDRTNALLGNLLASPPDPHPAAKSAKQSRKKPSKKK